jgi:hypothetical protein
MFRDSKGSAVGHGVRSHMVRRLLTPAFAFGFLALVASSAAAHPATWNNGYGWWPGGFGYPPRTTAAPDYPCSVTAYGPAFHKPAGAAGAWTQSYGAGTSCRGGVGTKTLTVYDQVQGAKGAWFTIAGSQVTVGATTHNPVHTIRTRSAALGHTYRTVVMAHLVVPNGFAGCSLHTPPACQQTIDIKAVSTPIAP